MTVDDVGAWREVMNEEDRRALDGYARPRGQLRMEKVVLLVIDVIEAFVGPDLPVVDAQRVSRQACGERAWRALPHIARLLERFRETDRTVVFTKPDPAQSWVGPATRGETSPEDRGGSAIVEGVRPREDESVVVKTKASAFFGTPLVSGLVRDSIETLVLVGGTTSGCVRATAVDGTSYGFEVVVAEDACFDRSRLSHLVALADLDVKYGRVMMTSSVLEALKPR